MDHLADNGLEIGHDGLLDVVGEESPQGCGSDCHMPHAWAVAIRSATASGVSLVTVCAVDTGRVTRKGRRNWTVSCKNTRRCVPCASGRVGARGDEQASSIERMRGIMNRHDLGGVSE